MQVKVKDGIIHIPKRIWEKAHLAKDGKCEVQISQNKIVITAQLQKEILTRVNSVKELGVVGMWADRDDIDDSREWVRKQRTGWKKRIKASG